MASDWKFRFPSIENFEITFDSFVEEGLWFKRGSVEDYQITNATGVNQDNYITLFTIQPGARIIQTNRYSFSLSRLLAEYFSVELPGLWLYLSEEPGKRNTLTWNSLTSQTKQIYITRSKRLIKEAGLIIGWPTDPILPPRPDMRIYQNWSFLPSNSSFYFPNTYIGTPNIKNFIIKNMGNDPLTLTGNPIITVSGVNVSGVVISGVNVSGTVDMVSGSSEIPFLVTQPSISFLQADQSSEFSIIFNPSLEGEKEVSINIENDDPDIINYQLNISGRSLRSSTVIDPEGNLSVSEDLIVAGNSYLGNESSDIININGVFEAEGPASFNQDVTVQGSLYQKNSITNELSFIGDKEFLYTINYNDWTEGQDFEINLTHDFGHFPDVKVINNSTLEEMYCEVSHVNRDQISIAFSAQSKKFLFQNSQSPPLILLISLN